MPNDAAMTAMTATATITSRSSAARGGAGPATHWTVTATPEVRLGSRYPPTGDDKGERLSALRHIRLFAGFLLLTVATAYLVRVVDGRALSDVARAVLADPVGIAVALTCYATAFVLRSWAWRATLPGLRFGQSWAALHVSLLGNHVLPLRLGEVLRVTSVLRRTPLAPQPVIASTVLLRAADLLGVLVLAALAVPGLVAAMAGQWWWVAVVVTAVLAALAAGWSGWLARGGAAVRFPTLPVGVSVLLAWVLESVVILQVARLAGHPLGFAEAVAVTAVTIAVQAVAVTPGGLGTYEAAATAVLVTLGVPAGPAFAVALSTHAVKTGYALLVGVVALLVPDPGYWGRLRLPRRLPARPSRAPVPADAPVVAFLPVHNEEATVGAVVAGLPPRLHGHPVVLLVVDDGSVDASASRAAAAGAVVLSQPSNLGLGAAVRRGLAEAVSYRPAAVLYLDGDGEYRPADAAAVLEPVLTGAADYVVGSRFAGQIERMLPHRRLGNQILNGWVRWLTRRRDITDGQSGYRCFSPEAAADAEIVHDYNYAQVLTLDLLAKGYRYAEVPISYSFRDSGTSFVRLGRYLRKVVPAVHRELNADRQSSTT
ncbi:MAG: lysylphosphatidylglycerol synthase domain-containing protein [Pseudonocardiaceae bacterium]